jgi:spermidine synthase
MTRRPKRRNPTPPVTPPAPRHRNIAIIWLTVVGLPLVLAAVGAYALFARTEPPPAPALPAAGQPALVEEVESLYNDIRVTRRTDGNLMLLFGAKRLNYVESIINPNDPLDLPVTYTQSMVAGALAYPSGLDDMMIIGLGGGRTSWYLHKSLPAMNYTAVELDPEVARLGQKYFGVAPEPGFNLEINDGRVWLTRTDKTFDVILVDAYRGPFVPFHLLTREFYELVASHLKPGGVAVQNVEPSTMLFDSAVATIGAAFEHLVFLQGAGNIVIVAYNGPEKTDAEIATLAAERQARYGFRYDIGKLIAERRYEPSWDRNAKPLTDDFAPVEYLKAIDRHNEKQT